MSAEKHAQNRGFVADADEGQAFWFLSTLTLNKVTSDDSGGRLSIVAAVHGDSPMPPRQQQVPPHTSPDSPITYQQARMQGPVANR